MTMPLQGIAGFRQAALDTPVVSASPLAILKQCHPPSQSFGPSDGHAPEPHPSLSPPPRPNVLCFHLKRFKHSANAKQPSSKIESFVEFPLHSLNMRPHTSAHVTLAQGADAPPTPSPLPPAPAPIALASEPTPEQLYDLFGVAVHHGTMDKGHYTAYVRSGADWFHCDDAIVTLTTAEEVRSCMGYMLFYVQKTMS